jgi:hypothetical protein
VWGNLKASAAGIKCDEGWGRAGSTSPSRLECTPSPVVDCVLVIDRGGCDDVVQLEV